MITEFLSGLTIFTCVTFRHEFPWNLDLTLLIQRSFNIVCLLGGYGICPGKENTNLECSLIIAIHHLATVQFVKQMSTNDQLMIYEIGYV
jgi:hypothetical protein